MHIDCNPFVKLAAIITAALSLSCKPVAQASKTDSLENFAAAEVLRFNECGAEKVGSLIDAPLSKSLTVDGTVPATQHAALLEAAMTSLTSLPEAMSRTLAGRTTIVLTNDVGAYCGNGGELEGCFKRTNSSATGLAQFKVYQSASVKLVRHSLLQTVSRLFAELRGWFPRDVVALAYIYDRAQAGATYDKQLARYLGKDEATRLLSEAKQGTLTALPKTLAWHGFANRVLAEAADSYFCNNWASFDQNLVPAPNQLKDEAVVVAFARSTKNTRKAFANLFPHTFAAFEPLVGQWTSYAQTVGEVEKNVGLSLQDEHDFDFEQDFGDELLAGFEDASSGNGAVGYEIGDESYTNDGDEVESTWTGDDVGAQALPGCGLVGGFGLQEYCPPTSYVPSRHIGAGLSPEQIRRMMQAPPAEQPVIPSQQLGLPPVAQTVPTNALPTQSSIGGTSTAEIIEQLSRAQERMDDVTLNAFVTAARGMTGSAGGALAPRGSGTTAPDGTFFQPFPSTTSGSGTVLGYGNLYTRQDQAAQSLKFWQEAARSRGVLGPVSSQSLNGR